MPEPAPLTEKMQKRRALIFVVAMVPFIALSGLLLWGQVRTSAAPVGLLEYGDTGALSVESRMAPSLIGVDAISGEPAALHTFRGNVVMVSFWSSWCAVCRSEAADLAAVHREYLDSPVKFLGVAILDQPANIPPYLRQYDVGYPNIVDEVGKSAVSYGVTGVPEKYFINEDGEVVRKVIGPLSRPELRAILDAMIEA